MLQNYFNERTKFSLRIDGYANSMGDEIARYLEQAHEQVSGKLMSLTAQAENSKSLARKKALLERQKAEVEGVLREVYQDIGRDIKDRAVALAQATPEIAVGMIDASLPAGVVSGLEVPFLNKPQILAWFDSFQVEGHFFPDYLNKLEQNAAARIIAASKQSLIQQESVRDAGKRLQNALGIGRKSAEGLASTAAHSAAIHAEVQLYTENPNRIDGVQYMVELDRKTCPECIPLDREIWPVSEAVVPPIHWKCRCWLYPILLTVDRQGKTVPIEDALSDWEEEQGREGQDKATSRIARKETDSRWINHRDGTRTKVFDRSDVDFIDRKTTYQQWIEGMVKSSNPKDRAFAREVLGPTRFKFVEAGKLKVQSLYYNGKLRTIADLKELYK